MPKREPRKRSTARKRDQQTHNARESAARAERAVASAEVARLLSSGSEESEE